MNRPKVLNARFVETVSRPGRYGDGRGGYGLFLNVKPTVNGRLSKSWVQRIRVSNRITHIGLGPYPIVTLAEARGIARDNRRGIAQGRDPRGGGIPTFRQALEKVLELQRPNWRSHGKSEQQWRSTLGTYAESLMSKRVSKIHSGEVMEVLLPIWNTRRETAKRVRQRIGAVMKWAIAQGLRPDNPAGDQVLQALPKNGVARRHFAALPHAQVGRAVRTIRATGAWPSTKLAFEFLVLTAARSGEVRLATWEEFDLDNAVWTVPAERMKIGREHRVPLSGRALEVLAEAQKYSDGERVFPSPTGKDLSNASLSVLCNENAVGAVPHGFRSSFRDWCGETGQPRELAEQALAHVVKNKVEAAYARSDLFERRRTLMDAWATYIAG